MMILVVRYYLLPPRRLVEELLLRLKTVWPWVMWQIMLTVLIVVIAQHPRWKRSALARIIPEDKRQGIADWLHERRRNALVWIGLAILGFVLAGGIFLLVGAVSGPQVFENGKWLESSGFWTAILAMVAAPIGWFAWVIRDFGKIEDRRHAASVAAREHFNRLREWATDLEQINRIAAIYELESYLDVDSPSNRIPAIIAQERPWYAESTAQFFAELIRSRSNWEQGVHTPTTERQVPDGLFSAHLSYDSFRYAISRIIFRHGDKIHDFENADLRYLDLRGSFLGEVNLTNADLRWVDLKGSNLQNAILNSAKLDFSDFRFAHLRGAHFVGNVFEGATFGHASMEGAHFLSTSAATSDFSHVNFRGADMENAVFTECQMQEAILHMTQFRLCHFSRCQVRNVILNRGQGNLLKDCHGNPSWTDPVDNGPSSIEDT